MVLTADEHAIETKHLGFTISPHEECGVEEAVRIVEAGGGEVVALTLGSAEAEEQLRDCMAIGADRGILLKTNGEEWDAQATAAAIMDVIRGANPPSCTSTRVMPPDGPSVTECQKAALAAWLAEPKVLQTHRTDDTSPAAPYLMPPFN